MRKLLKGEAKGWDFPFLDFDFGDLDMFRQPILRFPEGLACGPRLFEWTLLY